MRFTEDFDACSKLDDGLPILSPSAWILVTLIKVTITSVFNSRRFTDKLCRQHPFVLLVGLKTRILDCFVFFLRIRFKTVHLRVSWVHSATFCSIWVTGSKPSHHCGWRLRMIELTLSRFVVWCVGFIVSAAAFNLMLSVRRPLPLSCRRLQTRCPCFARLLGSPCQSRIWPATCVCRHCRSSCRVGEPGCDPPLALRLFGADGNGLVARTGRDSGGGSACGHAGPRACERTCAACGCMCYSTGCTLQRLCLCLDA
jgi:hypothetical protein